jgi:hypothetical protein
VLRSSVVEPLLLESHLGRGSCTQRKRRVSVRFCPARTGILLLTHQQTHDGAKQPDGKHSIHNRPQCLPAKALECQHGHKAGSPHGRVLSRSGTERPRLRSQTR